VSYVQNFLVDCRIFDERLNEIIDDECDDEIVIHMLSQLKEKHVVDVFSCYDVLILDRE
jgi:hypothetical protein